MKTFPCAKINLGLYVVERRPDGYHNLETVFYPIPLCDELEATVADSDRLEVLGLGSTTLATQEDALFSDNLVMRVVGMLRAEGRDIPPLHIRLCKNIPTGAGLGGGSSDAAYMMRMLNDMFSLSLSDNDMESRLARLGADCPFFVRCQPVMATGIGDQFTPLEGLSSPHFLSGLHLLLVKPSDFVSTREAYANIRPRQPRHPLAESLRRPIGEWQQLVGNDFERSVFPLHPIVAGIKQSLIHAGALYAAMSGSGSSVFGLFAKAPDAALIRCFAPHFVFTASL